MNVWRLNIRPASQEGVDPREFCFKKKIIGVGWPIDEASTEVGWEQYREKAKQKYKISFGRSQDPQEPPQRTTHRRGHRCLARTP
jgi:hypothetical protein